MKKETTKPKNRFGISLAIAAILIVTGIVGYVVYNAYLDRADRQRFETVRQSIETLRGRLQAAAGEGEEWTSGASCSEASVLFEEGDKGCSIGVDLKVAVTSASQASALIEKYKTEFKNAADLFNYEDEGLPPNPPVFPAGLANGYDGSGFRERETNMLCSSLFQIDDRFKKDTTKRILEISFGCNDGARKLHYSTPTVQEIIDSY